MALKGRLTKLYNCFSLSHHVHYITGICSTNYKPIHYNYVTMSATASKITSLTIVYSTVYSSADQRKPLSSASLAFVRGIRRWPVNTPHKGPVTRKMFPFDDVIMHLLIQSQRSDTFFSTSFMGQQDKMTILLHGTYWRQRRNQSGTEIMIKAKVAQLVLITI